MPVALVYCIVLVRRVACGAQPLCLMSIFMCIFRVSGSFLLFRLRFRFRFRWRCVGTPNAALMLMTPLQYSMTPLRYA